MHERLSVPGFPGAGTGQRSERNEPLRLPLLLGAALAGGAALCLAPAPAPAAPGASGTRLTVGGGPPRFYMTYGHMEEPELYAPIVAPLGRFEITFERRGGSYAVLHRGRAAAEWRVVTTREELPDHGDPPVVLVMGGSVYVPVRKLGELLPIEVRWEKRANLVVLAARGEKPREAPRRRDTPAGGMPRAEEVRGEPPSPAPPRTAEPAAAAEAPAESQAPVILTAVELERVGSAVRIRVRASGSVRPTWTPLQHLRPPRLALDFPGARWAARVALPAGVGDVLALRTGQLNAATARLALDLRSPRATFGSLAVGSNEVTAAIGQPAGAAHAGNARIEPGLEARIRMALAGRDPQRSATRRPSSRGGRSMPRTRPDSASPSSVPQPALERDPTSPGDQESSVEDGSLPAPRNAWRYIVIHHSASPAGSLAGFDRQHRARGWDGVAYHFVITNGRGGPDGGLEISERWWAQKHGAHAGGRPADANPDERNSFNEFGLGICLVGNFESSRPSRAQLATLAALLIYLRREFGISEQDIVGHRHVKSTACPGRAFPWTTLDGMLQLSVRQLSPRAMEPTMDRCPWCRRAPAAPDGGRGVPVPFSGFGHAPPLASPCAGAPVPVD